MRDSLSNGGDDLIGNEISKPVKNKNAEEFNCKIVTPSLVSNLVVFPRMPS